MTSAVGRVWRAVMTSHIPLALSLSKGRPDCSRLKRKTVLRQAQDERGLGWALVKPTFGDMADETPAMPTLEDWQHWTLVMGRAQQMMMEFWADSLKKDQPFPSW